MQFDRTIGRMRVLNAGSVGMPFGEPGAYWVVLGPGVQHRHDAVRPRACGAPHSRDGVPAGGGVRVAQRAAAAVGGTHARGVSPRRSYGRPQLAARPPSRAIRSDIASTLERAVRARSGRCASQARGRAADRVVQGSRRVLRAAGRTRESEVSEVVAASTGNHGAAVAWAARELGVSAQVFVPVGANAVKVARIKSLGARLTEVGATSRTRDERRSRTRRAGSRAAARRRDGRSCARSERGRSGSSCSSSSRELRDAVRARRRFGAHSGRGGGGEGATAQRACRRCAGGRARRVLPLVEVGRVVTTPTADTIADGLATTRPTEANVIAVRTLVDEMVLVTERGRCATPCDFS